MLHCPCEERPIHRFGRATPRLFNWITVLLLTGWVALVMMIAGTTSPDAFNETTGVEAFIRELF